MHMDASNLTEKDAMRILTEVSPPLISDAMGKCLSRPLKSQTMESGIRPVHHSMKLGGPAYTVQCYPGATWVMELAVAEAPAGSIIVCNAQASDAGVVMGGLMSTFAQQRGITGAVIDGAVRDIEDLIELKFPMFSRHIVARSGTFAQIGDRQIPVTCGGVVVFPGDMVVADMNGVTVVPQAHIIPVARAAKGLEQWERQIKRLLMEGRTLDQAAQTIGKPPVVEI